MTNKKICGLSLPDEIEVERCIKKKYPNCVIVYVYSDGEVLFYENKEQSGNEENLHSGYMKCGKFIDITDF